MAAEPLTYLQRLLTEVDEAAAALRAVDVGPLVPGAREEQARLSARLDASPLTDETAPRRGSWAAALKLDGMPSEEIAAVELGNLLACHDEEPALAESFFDDPLGTLARAHGLICAGLVAQPGELRRTDQAIHDGAQGRVLYHAPDPDTLPARMAELAAGLSADDHPAVVAGTVHERLLEWQPYEAANGRVARVASRLVLRATGVDPNGVAVPERWLAVDPVGYYGEVAATIRRRGDLTRWLERATEALAAALHAAAGPDPDPPERARTVCAALAGGEELTITDYAKQAGVDLDTARADLRALARAGLLRLEPGTHGLRYHRTHD